MPHAIKRADLDAHRSRCLPPFSLSRGAKTAAGPAQIAFTILMLALIPACGSSEPEPVVTLTATDCYVPKIEMTVGGAISSGRDSRWTIVGDIDVKCSGSPIPDADLKVTFWWPGSTTALKTGSNGKARFQKVVQEDPKGHAYTVTIRGKDGETEASHKY